MMPNLAQQQMDYDEPDNAIPICLWKQVPHGCFYLQVRLSNGCVFDNVWVDCDGKIEGQITEGIAGYHGGWLGSAQPPPEGVAIHFDTACTFRGVAALHRSHHRVILHTSNGVQSRRMQGVLEFAGWEVRLAGAIGEHWIENDWRVEVERILAC